MTPTTTTKHLAVLSPLQGHALLLCIDGTGRVRSRQRLRAGDPADVPAGGHCVLAIPGSCVRSLWLDIDARSEAQAAAVARHRVEAHSADTGDALHVVLAPRRDGEPLRQVLVVASSELQLWLDAAAAMGLVPDAVVPDYMLVPAARPGTGTTDEDVRALEWEGHWLVRGPRLAFSAEPELARTLLEAPSHDPSADKATDDAFVAGLRDNAVDLLQHRFARIRDRAGARETWRRTAWLAGLLLLSPLLVTATDAARHALAATSLQAEARETAGRVLGDVPTGAPALALQAALDAGTGRGAAAAPMLAAVSAAVTQVPGLHLERLDMDGAGDAGATVAHGGPDDLDALAAQLAGQSISMTVEDSRASPGGYSSRIALAAEGTAP